MALTSISDIFYILEVLHDSCILRTTVGIALQDSSSVGGFFYSHKTVKNLFPIMEVIQAHVSVGPFC